MKGSLIYVGLDVHKETIVIARASGRKKAEVVRKIANDYPKLCKVLDDLGPRERLRVCYEAGPTGYDLARRLNAAGVCCVVVAPSLIPRQTGRRIKTDRRDARRLAELFRAGELVEVKIPEKEDEAMRDLERARDDAKNAERTARQQLDKFLLRQGRIWSEGTKWTLKHWRWIELQAFPAESSQRVLADYIRAAREATARVERLEKDIEELVERWSLRPLVRALMALRGVGLITAVVLAAEIGDYRRFKTPRELMSYLGMVPSEDSSGQRRKQGRLTRTGNGHVRRILVESSWNYRFRPRVSKAIAKRREGVSSKVREIAERAECRLSRRFHALLAKGKLPQKAVAAVARELSGFVWAIAQEVDRTAA
jgi:transposase